MACHNSSCSTSNSHRQLHVHCTAT